MEASRVTVGPDEDTPSVRIDANRPYVIGVTLVTLAALIIAVVAISRSRGLLAWVALIPFVVFGARYLYLVGPARLITRPWIAASGDGITARTARGITRYRWDRVTSVHWQLTGRPLAQYTIVQVTPKLGAPDDPYGPINPFGVSLWFLSRKKRSLEIGREFLSICRTYGAKTSLLVGKTRES
jgi:hypothetical protein